MFFGCKVFGSEEGTEVTAGDLNYLGADLGLQILDEYKPIVLTKLFRGQMVEFYATAIMGRGRDHAKWSPVCGVTFQPKYVGQINIKSRAKMLWDLDLEINAKDFDKEGRLEDYQKVEQLIADLHHVGAGTEESRTFKNAVTVEAVPGEFILSFETDGSMTPRVAFEKAFAELAERFSLIDEDFAAVL